MPDHRNVRRMSTDERDTILAAMEARQRLLQLAVKRSLTGNRSAGRDCGAVAVDRRLRRRRNPRMPVEADIVVGSEVDVGLVADQGFRAGDALMDAKVRIGDVEKLRGLPNQADLAKPFELRRIEPLGSGIERLRGGTAWRMIPGSSGGRRGQLVDQPCLGLRREAEQISPQLQRITPPRLYRGRREADPRLPARDAH